MALLSEPVASAILADYLQTVCAPPLTGSNLSGFSRQEKSIAWRWFSGHPTNGVTLADCCWSLGIEPRMVTDALESDPHRLYNLTEQPLWWRRLRREV